jgi:hypothetical protein
LLDTVASFSKHPSFVKIFLSNEGMEAVAKCYASRKQNDTPNCVAQYIRLIVSNTLCVLTQGAPSNEKAFSTIEKTGVLGQFIRYAPVDPERFAIVLQSLQTCLQLVKKKLKPGTQPVTF